MRTTSCASRASCAFRAPLSSPPVPTPRPSPCPGSYPPSQTSPSSLSWVPRVSTRHVLIVVIFLISTSAIPNLANALPSRDVDEQLISRLEDLSRSGGRSGGVVIDDDVIKNSAAGRRHGGHEVGMENEGTTRRLRRLGVPSSPQHQTPSFRPSDDIPPKVADPCLAGESSG